VNKVTAININTDDTALAAGAVSELLYGIERSESIIIGNVVQSEFLVTTHDAPNSPIDIARVKIVATNIEPRNSGNLIWKNLFHFVTPRVLAHSSYDGSIERNAGSIILTTNGVVIITCAITGVGQNE